MRNTGIMTISVLVLLIIFSSMAMALPKMFLPQEEFDFGFVPQASKITHVFWIKSVGEDTLKILNVKPG